MPSGQLWGRKDQAQVYPPTCLCPSGLWHLSAMADPQQSSHRCCLGSSCPSPPSFLPWVPCPWYLHAGDFSTLLVDAALALLAPGAFTVLALGAFKLRRAAALLGTAGSHLADAIILAVVEALPCSGCWSQGRQPHASPLDHRPSAPRRAPQRSSLRRVGPEGAPPRRATQEPNLLQCRKLLN